MDFKNVTAGTWIRTISLFISLISMVLVALGYNPLPFTEEQITKGVTVTALVISSLVAWWKQNSFTKNGIKAKQFRKKLDAKAVAIDSEDDQTIYPTGIKMN